MSRRLVVAHAFKIASVTAALAASSVAQASSVQTVFSAENALYGAGYSIGKADGWIDDDLRSAVRQYQADRPGLNATGELDSPTLAALGISGSGSQLVGGNVVASQVAAQRELGLALASAAQPAPEPEPERIAAKPEVATPEPVAESEPVVTSIAKVKAPVAKPEPQKAQEPVQKAEPEPVTKSEPTPDPNPEPEQVARARPQPEAIKAPAQPESEPTSEPIRIASDTRVSTRDEAAAMPAVEEPQEEMMKVASVSNTEEAEALMPREQTSAGINQETAGSDAGDQSQSTDRQGNVITRMFDFLFGWMV